MSKGKSISVADYLTQQINICGKSQREIADEVGYEKANVITMFKQGKTRLPINKVGLFAQALGVDKIHLLRLTMSEYSPETWEVIEQLLGKGIVSDAESTILDIVREASDGQAIMPINETEKEELRVLARSWKDREDESARAAAERVARDRKAKIKN